MKSSPADRDSSPALPESERQSRRHTDPDSSAPETETPYGPVAEPPGPHSAGERVTPRHYRLLPLPLAVSARKTGRAAVHRQVEHHRHKWSRKRHFAAHGRPRSPDQKQHRRLA